MELKPGYCKTDELWNINEKKMNRFMSKFIMFFDNKPGLCLDMGELNPKSKYLKDELNLNIEQVYGFDFNFRKMKKWYRTADIIFALEIIEHLQNPLWFMNEVKKCLKNDGSIYVTMPVHCKWLWMEGHYFEIPRKHFEKWILKPLKLKIVRYKRIYFIHDWRAIFIGIRPLIKLFKKEITIKALIRKMFYFKYDFYEIKKVDL